MVSRQSARTAEIPVSDALPEAARAFSVLWYPGNLRLLEEVRRYAEKAWQYWLSRRSSTRAIRWETVPASAGDLCSAHTQDRPQHLTALQGQHSDAPEWCRDSGYLRNRLRSLRTYGSVGGLVG